MTVAKGLGGGLPIGACLTDASPRRRPATRRPRLDVRRRPRGGRGGQRGARRGQRARLPRRGGPQGRAARGGPARPRPRRRARPRPDAGLRGRRGPRAWRGGCCSSSGWWSTPPARTPIRLLPPLTVSDERDPGGLEAHRRRIDACSRAAAARCTDSGKVATDTKDRRGLGGWDEVLATDAHQVAPGGEWRSELHRVAVVPVRARRARWWAWSRRSRPGCSSPGAR